MPSENLWKRNSEKIKLRGLGVSPGVAIGHVRLFHVSTLDVECSGFKTPWRRPASNWKNWDGGWGSGGMTRR